METQEKWGFVAKTISSGNIWEEVENVANIIKPIYMLIKFVDGED
jgi:hypothetical protein